MKLRLIFAAVAALAIVPSGESAAADCTFRSYALPGQGPPDKIFMACGNGLAVLYRMEGVYSGLLDFADRSQGKVVTVFPRDFERPMKYPFSCDWRLDSVSCR